MVEIRVFGQGDRAQKVPLFCASCDAEENSEVDQSSVALGVLLPGELCNPGATDNKEEKVWHRYVQYDNIAARATHS
jgi:hypothetical protein